MKPINLQNVHGCLEELETCSKGLAYLDHLYGKVLDDLHDFAVAWETTEAEAAAAARTAAPKAATAAEIKGLMTAWVDSKPAARMSRENLREAERRKAKLDRWMRTLEKRGGFAQSAQNGHALIDKGGGSVG